MNSLQGVQIDVQVKKANSTRQWALQQEKKLLNVERTILSSNNAFWAGRRIKRENFMLSKWAEIWFLEVFDDGDSESEFSLNDDFSVHWRVKHVFNVWTSNSTFWAL